DSASYTPGFVRGWFEVEVNCKPDNLAASHRIILEEISRLQRELVGEKELAKVKRQKAAEHVFGQQTVQDQAESLGRSYLSTDDPLFDEQYVKGIQRVTPQQIQAVARKYFRPERENTVTINPLGTGSQSGSEASVAAAESDVVKKTLPNGLTLLVKRHAVQPLVTVQAFVKAGILADTDADSGLASLTTSMMTKGTSKYTAAQIADYFDSIGGAISVDSQRNSSYLTCATLTEDFPVALDYCDQVLFHPTFPADEFAKEKAPQLTRIAARKGNPQAEVMDYWATLLPEDTPFHRTVTGTVDTVAKLTVADAKAMHRKYFSPGNMVLAVYGDIDPAKTLAELERRFGGLPRQDIEFPRWPDAHFAKSEKRAVLKNQQQGTSMVLLSYPIVSVNAQQERDAL
ncbi:MAG: insulinase family protein, partial [Planctomycetales bacterium]|nr:insulinase family protein [Planctomycetales bacterium]